MKLLFWKKPISVEKSYRVKHNKFEYPFYRKYPNGYLNFIGNYKINDIQNGRVLQKFRIWRILEKKKPLIVIVPLKENPNWREQFRTINKPLSFNYIYK